MDPAAAAGLYGFFSRLFLREVDPAFAEVLGGEVGRALLPRFSVAEAGTLGTSRFDEDFVHLTVVDLVPYASFYLRPDARIEAGLDNPLVAFYRAYGFEVDLEAARAVSPDHLGVALELASRLCAEEASADAGYAPKVREVRRRLLGEHLLPWAPVYLLAVKRSAYTELYREGAEVLLDLLLQDHAEC